MKMTISKQFSLIFIGIMTATVVGCLLMNSFFLEDFYLNKKIDVVYDAYGKIKEAAASDSYATDEFIDELDSICSMYNITAIVIDAESAIVYESSNGGRDLEPRFWGFILKIDPEEPVIIESNENYLIQRSGTGDRQYLEMTGRISNEISFFIRTPMQSIRESADLAFDFYLRISIICTLLGAILIWIVTRKITKPISELSDISEKMVHLDFDAKYHGKSKNEIGVLGDNINKMSVSLERSISDLKTANAELMKDIEQKEKIDAMRTEFIANVSHELKTPIALIQGYAEGLKDGITDDPESMSFYCDVIIDEAAKMNTMVKQLLTLNSFESGRDPVKMERFDISVLVSNYIRSASMLAEKNGISVKFSELPSIFVWGDEFKIEEVIANYFSNAVNHCNGEKIIDISIKLIGNKARVCVFNTGDMIPEEALEHLWEKFYKVDKARTREYGGSGVGLSIVKAIMDSMNQGYGVENYTNGVMFWFELETVEEHGEN